jgi:predicted phosphodiesterase
MPTIRLLSDLHLEFQPGTWREFVGSIEPNADVLVLAGDIATDGIADALRAFCARWRRVVFVAGNHEFYGSSVDATNERLAEVSQRGSLANLHWLENQSVTIDGVRFLGASLWFQDLPQRGPNESDPRHGLTDFYAIRGLEPWVYRQNAKTREWLDANVRAGDVVVTHHLPSERSTHPKYRGHPVNRFFLGCTTLEIDTLIRERGPRLWLHGHTHESMDYLLGETRVVCNPRGYWGHEMNPAFDPGLTIEVNR